MQAYTKKSIGKAGAINQSAVVFTFCATLIGKGLGEWRTQTNKKKTAGNENENILKFNFEVN